MKFEDYVEEHGQPLMRLAFVLTRDAHLAEDLTQTALSNAFRRWNRVAGARDPHSYVSRILINAHLDRQRRRSTKELPEPFPRDRPSLEPDHADAIASKDELRSMLDELQPRARTVLVLRYYLDLDDASIAKAMGVTPSTVRSTASRALAFLKDQLSVQTQRRSHG